MLMFPGVFMPIIPAIAVSGILMGIRNLFTIPGPFDPTLSFVQMNPQYSDLINYVGIFADVGLANLPVLIGWSEAVYFGASPLLGVLLGLLLVSPSLINGWGAILGAYESFNIVVYQITRLFSSVLLFSFSHYKMPI